MNKERRKTKEAVEVLERLVNELGAARHRLLLAGYRDDSGANAAITSARADVDRLQRLFDGLSREQK